MKFVVKHAVMLTLGGVLAAGTALAETKVEKAVQDAKTGAFDLFNKETVTVEFQKGSAALSDGERSDLKALVEAAKADTGVGRVVVAAWSDSEYPAAKEQTLPKAEQDLAKARAHNVKSALETLGIKKVETYSMAEHPSWIARTFNTKDAKLKGTGEPKNLDDATVQQIGKQLRDAGGPNKAVVFVLRAGESVSH